MALQRRLSTLDAGFLYGERPDQTMHVGGCMVYDGAFTANELRRTVEQRLHLLPRYRQKVVFPPFGIAHPTWEDDPDFNLDNHIEEDTLPAPGDDRVLSEFGGQVYATMLDRNHPLWKLIVLHGRADGNTALIWKVHHAMVDGVSSVELTMTLHDLTRDAEPPEPPAAPWQPRPIPDQLTLMQHAVRDQLIEAAEAWTDESFRVLRPARAVQEAERIAAALTTAMPMLTQPARAMPFNGPITGRRQFAWATFSFPEIRFIKSVLGGTVNDLVLAILSGALGRYLRAHGQRTEGLELRAMCPVSMRPPDQQQALGNLVSIMIAPLYVGIDDPVARLKAEREAMERLKQENQAGGLYALNALSNRIPPAWQAIAGRFPVSPSTVVLHTVSTNVPGPQIPLYLAGRRLTAMYPLGIISANVGLFNAILTYDQQLTFGALVDPTLMPDVWFFADCLKESFAELQEAAEGAAPVEMRRPEPIQATMRPDRAGSAGTRERTAGVP